MVTLVEIIDVHSGRKNRNGGEYGFGRIVPLNGGRVQYWTTAEFPFCPRCGLFHEECNSEYVTMTKEEVQAILENAERYYEYNDGRIIVDLTGHEPVTDEWGGCKVCYP